MGGGARVAAYPRLVPDRLPLQKVQLKWKGFRCSRMAASGRRESPIHRIFRGLIVTAPKGADRGARRDVYQKAVGIEGAYPSPPWWKLVWKQVPLATRSQQIKDGVHDSTHVGRARPSTIASCRQERFDQFPRRIRQVRLVASVQHQQVPRDDPTPQKGCGTFQTSSETFLLRDAFVDLLDLMRYCPNGKFGPVRRSQLLKDAV